jgi:hypothetical protein
MSRLANNLHPPSNSPRPFEKGTKEVGDEETPKPVVQPHPISEDEYIDSLLVDPSSSPSSAGMHDPELDATHHQPGIIDPARTHPELKDQIRR